jgi:CSLREA domain-containing protein
MNRILGKTGLNLKRDRLTVIFTRIFLTLSFLIVLSLVSQSSIYAATYTVTKTADTSDGTCDADCSLREAVVSANANSGADTVNFAIPTSDGGYIAASGGIQDYFNITTTTPLQLTDSSGVFINGYSQSGASRNTTAFGQTLDTILKIQITYIPSAGGFTVSMPSSNNHIAGIDFIRGSSTIDINPGSNNWIEGCYFGSQINGTQYISGDTSTIISNGSNNNIFGTNGDGVGDSGERNLFMGSSAQYKIVIMTGTNSNNVIAGNYFGVDKTSRTCETKAQNRAMVSIFSGTGNRVGSNLDGISDAEEANILACVNANARAEIQLGTGTGTIIQGNYIGTNAYGDNLNSGFAEPGIRDNGTASFNIIKRNIIKYNGFSGIVFLTSSSVGNTISENIISDNVGLGIDFGNDGVTANDVGDIDTGQNNLMNHPVLKGIIKSGSNLVVTADLDFNPAEAPFTIELFDNNSIDASGYGEGKYFIGSVTTSTIGSNVVFTVPITGAAPSTSATITSTATNVGGSTSEFSASSPVYSAFSPWLQINWIGGAGQASWYDASKYSSFVNIETLTANQFVLTNTEKFSNTGFETDLTSWNAGAYNLYDQFTTNRSAGTLNGTSAEPFGGIRTVADTNNVLSITGSILNFATGGLSAGDPGIWYPSLPRSSGLTIIGSITPTVSGNAVLFGFDNNNSGNVNGNALQFASNDLRVFETGSARPIMGAYVGGTTYSVAVSLRSPGGAYYFIKGGTYTNWTLIWISSIDTANPVFPASIVRANPAAFTADDIRVPSNLWIPTPLAYSTFGTGGATATETSGPENQTTPSLALTGGTVAGGVLSITPTFGSELVTNGTFDSDIASWGNFVTLPYDTLAWSAGSLHAVSDGVGTALAGSSVWAVTNGTWYQSTYGKTLNSGTNPTFEIRSAALNGSTRFTLNSTGLNTYRSLNTENNLFSFFNASGATSDVNIDNVSSKQLTLSSLFSTVSTSTSDVIVDANVTLTSGTQAGLVLNLDSTSSPANFVIAYYDGTNVRLDKVVSGIYTNLINSAATYSAGATMRVIKSGTAYRLYYNNSLIGAEQTISDAGIISNTTHGLFSTYANNTFDNFAIWSRTGNAVPDTDLTATRDTATKYAGTASVKLIAPASNDANFTQSINAGDTNKYNLVAYSYTDGSTITANDLSLYYDTSVVSTSYTAVGGGWFKLTGVITGSASSKPYGVQVKAGKTVYVDNMSLNNYATSGTLTSSIFDIGSSANMGILTYAATTPTNTSVSVKVRTSDDSTMTGAPAFSSCTAISSGSDISANSCVSDSHRYVQYEVTLSNTDNGVTPTFTSFSLDFSTNAPTTLTGTTASDTSITWSWTDNADNESGFYIQDSGDTTKCTAIPSSGIGSTVNCVETGLNPNTSYTRKVVAYYAGGNSDASNDASAVTHSIAPTSSNITGSQATSIWTNDPAFTFTNTDGFGVGSVEYFRYVFDMSSSYVFTDTETQWTGSTLNQIATLDSNSMYLHLQGYNSEDVANGTLDLGPYYFDATNPTTPGTPSTTTPTSSTDQTWSWTASTDATSGISNYLWRTTGTAVTSGSTLTNSVNTSLGEGTYNLLVKSVDNAGNESTESLAGTLIVDQTVPTVPGMPNTTASPTNDSTPSWSWTASTDSNSGLAIDAYTIQWCQNIDFTGCSSNIDTSTTNSYIHGSALSDGTWYTRVKAIDSVNNESNYSSIGQVLIDQLIPSINITDIGLISGVSDQDNLLYYFTAQNPYIQGNTEANSTVHFKYNDHDYTTVAGADGKYGISISNPDLPRTTVSLTYYAVDPAGNISQERTLTLVIGVENFPVSLLYTPSNTTVSTTPTPSPTPIPSTTPTPVPTPVTGYRLEIKILDENGQPIVGAKVTLYSTPKEAFTDERGIATFTNVEEGDHRVVIKYESRIIEQSIKISGDTTKQDITIEIKPANIFATPEFIITSLIALVVLSILLFVVIKQKRSKV